MFRTRVGQALLTAGPAMKALVEAGAKPDIKADDGTTLALAAAYGGNLAAMVPEYFSEESFGALQALPFVEIATVPGGSTGILSPC